MGLPGVLGPCFSNYYFGKEVLHANLELYNFLMLLTVIKRKNTIPIDCFLNISLEAGHLNWLIA